MPLPAEDTRLLGDPGRPNPPTEYPMPDATQPAPGHDGWVKPRRPPVNVNTLKRNMSIAKGFMDISLLTANASQLKHLLLYGDSSSYIYYIIFSGLILSLIFQVVTGVLLIVKERFDINLESDQASADLYNNITTFLVFITLLLNVFVSSFGVSIAQPPHHDHSYPVKHGVGGYGSPSASQSSPLTENNLAPLNNTGFGPL